MRDNRPKGLITGYLFVLLISVASVGVAFAQQGQKPGEEKKGPPPALVVVAPITKGEVQPMTDYVGSVFYTRVSDVAAEVEGSVLDVRFEEGRRVRAGDTLVVLGSEVLDTRIAATEASLGQVGVELEKAGKDLKRMENLYREESIAESVYEEHFFKVKGLEKQAASLDAELKRLQIEKDKKSIRAPFGGVVVEKSVEKGEWVSPGGKVAVIAEDGEVDIVVEVPEEVLAYLKTGDKIALKSGGAEFTGVVRAFIPRGDLATRTFPVKIRAKNPSGKLREGMEARASLPSGPMIKGLLLPRDAVIKKFGMDIVFVVLDGKAKMIPVGITGFHNGVVGVAGPGLEAGQSVVVKGNERVMDGQPVTVMGK